MQKLQVLLMTLLLILSGGSFAAVILSLEEEDSCPEVDHRNKSVLGTIRDQGKIGWCFAFTAADLYSVALGRRVSPFDIAVNYFREYPQDGKDRRITRMEGGTQGQVFNSVSKWGLCPDKYFSGYTKHSVPGLYLIDELATSTERMSHSEKTEIMSRKLYPIAQKVNPVFPMTPAPQIREALIESDPREYPLVSLADKVCGDKRFPIKSLARKIFLRNQGDRQDYFKFLNDHLAGGGIVSVGYNHMSIKTGVPKPVLDHISSIVGSRKINGKCEYLLRNSWGDQIKHVHPSLRHKYEEGFLWLDADFLFEMGEELQTIVKRKPGTTVTK